MQLLLIAEQAATATAIAAEEEAAVTATSLKVENRCLQLLLAATGYITLMTRDEHLQALHRQVQYFQYLNE